MAFKLSDLVKHIAIHRKTPEMRGHLADGKDGLFRQYFQMSTWIWLLLFGIVSAGGLIWISSHQAMKTSLQLQVLSQLSMHGQRLAKASFYSIRGDNTAFDQLEESRDAFSKGMHLLLEGGDDTDTHYVSDSDEDFSALHDIQRVWREMNQSVMLIQSKKKYCLICITLNSN